MIRIVDELGNPLGETKVDQVPIELVALSLTGIDIRSGLLTLGGPWSDLPEDALYILQYSHDGEHWLALASQRGAPIEEVEPAVFGRLPGSDNGFTRILISAGWSGGIVDGPVIALPNKAPVLTLQLPLDQAAYAINELVETMATALDPEDRDLSDQIEWSSSIDGALGVRASVATWTLSAGNHQITASVTDSDGLSSQMSSNIMVAADLVQAILTAEDQEFIALYLTPPAGNSDDGSANGESGPSTGPQAQPNEPNSDGGGGFPLLPIGLVLLVGAGAGYFLRIRPKMTRN